MPEIKKKGSVLLPIYDELGTTVQRTFRNLALRMREVPQVDWGLYVGVNGTTFNEEIARIEHFLQVMKALFQGIHLEVRHYETANKENAMNQLAALTMQVLGTNPDFIIGTDAKVYRQPGSFVRLIEEFYATNSQSRKVVGGSILPYPVEVYKEHFELTPEQELFYVLLEIDKDPMILDIFPKDHVRGTLYITNGDWEDLIVGVPDDFTLTRRTRLNHGNESVYILPSAVGYVIPRQSFSDYFSVRYHRAMKHEHALEDKYPELAGTKEIPMDPKVKEEKLKLLKQKSPEKAALFQTKKSMDSLVRDLVKELHASSSASDRKTRMIAVLNSYVHDLKTQGYFVPTDEINLAQVTEVALVSHELAAKMIICYYRYIILALASEPNSVTFGPRLERYRGMLPLDGE